MSLENRRAGHLGMMVITMMMMTMVMVMMVMVMVMVMILSVSHRLQQQLTINGDCSVPPVLPSYWQTW